MFTDAFIQRVKDERAKGKLTIEEIADKYGIGSATVKRWTRKEVYDGPRRPAKEESKQTEKDTTEVRRGRRPSFGSADEALLSKIAERGYSEAMTFAKWLNATAVKRPNVVIATAHNFFKKWWEKNGTKDNVAESGIDLDTGDVNGDAVEADANDEEVGGDAVADASACPEASDDVDGMDSSGEDVTGEGSDDEAASVDAEADGDVDAQAGASGDNDDHEPGPVGTDEYEVCQNT